MGVNQIIIKIMLAALNNVFNSFSKIKFHLKSILSIKNEIPQMKNMFKISLRDQLNGDLLFSFSDEVMNQIDSGFSTIPSNPERNNKIRNQDTIFKLLTLIAATLSDYLKQASIKINIGIPEKLENQAKSYLFYEQFLTIVLSSSYGGMIMSLALKEIHAFSDLKILLVGFSKDFLDQFIITWITKGIEIFSANSVEEASSIIQNNKISFCIIDYYMIEKKLDDILDNLTGKLNYFLNIILSASRNEVEKLKNISYFSPYSQIIGVFSKTQSYTEIESYIEQLIKETGVTDNEKRRYIRVKIKKHERFFIGFYLGDELARAYIKDLSLLGIRVSLEDEKFLQDMEPGKILNNVEVFLNYNHLILDCTVIYRQENDFSLLFNKITVREEETIARAIFKLLPHCKNYEGLCDDNVEK